MCWTLPDLAIPFNLHPRYVCPRTEWISVLLNYSPVISNLCLMHRPYLPLIVVVVSITLPEDAKADRNFTPSSPLSIRTWVRLSAPLVIPPKPSWESPEPRTYLVGLLQVGTNRADGLPLQEIATANCFTHLKHFCSAIPPVFCLSLFSAS